MNKIKVFSRKNVVLGLLILLVLIVAFITFSPLAREIINDFPLRGLDPWERKFEVIDFHSGRRAPESFPEWDTTDVEWKDMTISIIEHDYIANPADFVNIRDKNVALEAGNKVFSQLQKKELEDGWNFTNYVPVRIFFNTSTNQWFILYLHQTPRDEPLQVGGGGLTIVIDGKDGSIVKIFYA